MHYLRDIFINMYHTYLYAYNNISDQKYRSVFVLIPFLNGTLEKTCIRAYI